MCVYSYVADSLLYCSGTKKTRNTTNSVHVCKCVAGSTVTTYIHIVKMWYVCMGEMVSVLRVSRVYVCCVQWLAPNVSCWKLAECRWCVCVYAYSFSLLHVFLWCCFTRSFGRSLRQLLSLGFLFELIFVVVVIALCYPC